MLAGIDKRVIRVAPLSLSLSLSPNKEDRRQAASNAYAGTRTQSAVMIVIIRKGLIYVRTEYYSLQSPRVYSV